MYLFNYQSLYCLLFLVVLRKIVLVESIQIEATPDAKRLYDDLLSNYNRLIRPVQNHTETLTVKLGLKISQLIEMNLKNQVMTTNLWVVQSWNDYKLKWDPQEYGGVDMLYVPPEHIWLPDIVLFNNADGNYEVTLMTKAILSYTGEVIWVPPSIYKSSCEINVQYFPFDEQSCLMKFASWTYNGLQVDLKHINQVSGSNIVKVGIDLSEFYPSVEWDILAVPATRNEEYYPCCTEPYSDITFKITLRRKTLFYTVNLIIPCVGITFLTVLVFYLPSDSGEKVTLCVSILLSLTVFFLLLAEIIPPTSLAVPLLGKYLLFTMILVTSSIWVTVCVLNVHFRGFLFGGAIAILTCMISRLLSIMALSGTEIYAGAEPFADTAHRSIIIIPTLCTISIFSSNNNGLTTSPSTHKMSPIVRKIFIQFMPKLLVMERTTYSIPEYDDDLPPRGYSDIEMQFAFNNYKIPGHYESNFLLHNSDDETRIKTQSPLGFTSNMTPRTLSANVLSALQGVRFIAQHIREADKSNEIVEDWKFVSMVLDRFFFWVFTLACIGGTFGIIFQAPTLYDTRVPVHRQLSEIPSTKIFQSPRYNIPIQ